MLSRYQRGYVYLRGKRLKTWYGRFRQDTAEGRRTRNVRLGTPRELPSKAAAYKKLLVEFIDAPVEALPALESPKFAAIVEATTFKDLIEGWKKAEGPNLGNTTFNHYSNALRAYVEPTWADRAVDSINRAAIQEFLAEQAKDYSKSSLKSMRLVLQQVLGWAEKNGDLKARPQGWLEGIRLPKKCGGRKLVRVVLKPEHTVGIIEQLHEPYDCLVLFVALLGRRIEEAIGLKPEDLDDDNVLHIRRVVYEGRVEELEEEQTLPLGQEHSDLIGRVRRLGKGQEWVFRSEAGTLINPGNARRRYLKPAANAIGVKIGGWHDFRHTLTTALRKAGVHPKVVSSVLGHSRVNLAMDVYDHADAEDIRAALCVVGQRLLPSCYPNGSPNESEGSRR
jgi:integrase